MKIKKILCPIDYSNFSNAANYYASLFAESSGAEIIYLNVLWPPNNDGSIEDQLEELHTQLTLRIRPIVHDLSYTFETRSGTPATEILKLASESNVDLIVMGTHGTTGLARLLHGSVCGKVLRNAPCPVMAVKDSMKVDWILPDQGQANEPPQTT